MSDTSSPWPPQSAFVARVTEVEGLWEVAIFSRDGGEVGVTQAERLEDSKRMAVDYLQLDGHEVTEEDVAAVW